MIKEKKFLNYLLSCSSHFFQVYLFKKGRFRKVPDEKLSEAEIQKAPVRRLGANEK